MTIIVTIKVIPGSGRLQWKLDTSNVLKCFLTQPAQKGRANEELMRFTAKTLGISQSNVVIMSGQQCRIKKLKIIMEITFDQFLGMLAIDRQTALF